MVKRTCPACGATRYSADDSGDWKCSCGARLTAELNEADWNEAGRAILQFQNEAFNRFVVSALREKAEREKGCEYCNGEYNTEIKAQYIRWHTPNDGTKHDMKVKCCPNCGRELPKEEK